MTSQQLGELKVKIGSTDYPLRHIVGQFLVIHDPASPIDPIELIKWMHVHLDQALDDLAQQIEDVRECHLKK